MSSTPKRVLIGDTIKFTWVNSGVTMSPVLEVYDGEETLVSTAAFIDSGGGHYYADYTVTSAGYYRLRGIGTASGKPYVRQHRIKGVTGEVD